MFDEKPEWIVLSSPLMPLLKFQDDVQRQRGVALQPPGFLPIGEPLGPHLDHQIGHDLVLAIGRQLLSLQYLIELLRFRCPLF